MLIEAGNKVIIIILLLRVFQAGTVKVACPVSKEDYVGMCWNQLQLGFP